MNLSSFFGTNASKFAHQVATTGDSICGTDGMAQGTQLTVLSESTLVESEFVAVGALGETLVRVERRFFGNHEVVQLHGVGEKERRHWRI